MQEIAAETSSLDQLHGPFLTGSLPSQGHSEILLQAREVKPQLISAVALPCSTHFTLPTVATYIEILCPSMATKYLPKNTVTRCHKSANSNLHCFSFEGHLNKECRLSNFSRQECSGPNECQNSLIADMQ